MISRRTFLATVAGGLLAAPLTAEAQEAGKIARIGVLAGVVAPSTPLFEAFRQGLQEKGYVEGQNIALIYRFAQGSDRLTSMAAELVRLKVDVIVTESGAAALAAKRSTQTIPIVMAVSGDPVGGGLVASLARPGGNITGLTLFSLELSGKRLQILKEVVPTATLVAVIWNPTKPAARDLLAETESAARLLDLQLHPVEARSSTDLDIAFRAVTAARPNALVTLADGMLWNNRTRIAEFAAKTLLPAIFPEREFAEAGGLMAYGPDLAASFRHAADYVDKILKGVKPADLPVEQPTKFELVINLKTAKALGLTIPQSLLQRADQVIE